VRQIYTTSKADQKQWLQDMMAEIDQDNIPAFLGGTCACVHCTQGAKADCGTQLPGGTPKEMRVPKGAIAAMGGKA
jgi:hypothetical protein